MTMLSVAIRKGEESIQLIDHPTDLNLMSSKLVYFLSRLEPVGDLTQSVPLEDGPDNLCKTQSRDGKVIALQAKH